MANLTEVLNRIYFRPRLVTRDREPYVMAYPYVLWSEEAVSYVMLDEHGEWCFCLSTPSEIRIKAPFVCLSIEEVELFGISLAPGTCDKVDSLFVSFEILDG